jgi:hypothetical protein
VADGGVLELFADPSRIGRSTDSTGREVLISCGAVLDHFCVALAAAGWEALIDRFPNPNNHDHLATLEFRRMEFVTDAHRARGRRSGIAKPIGFPSRRHRSGIRLNPCFARQSTPALLTLTSSPTIRGHSWPTRHGSRQH